MLKKIKIAFVTAAVLVGGAAGIAGAQGRGGGTQLDRQVHKAEVLAKFDSNKDGKLDATEKQAMQDARALKQFAKLDTDRNGLLSIEEFKAGRHHQGRMGRGKMRGGRGGDHGGDRGRDRDDDRGGDRGGDRGRDRGGDRGQP